MDTLFLYNTKTLKEKFKTKVFAGDNHITKINVQIPDNIGGYPKRECEFNLRAIIPEGNLSYMIEPSQPYFYITNDITEKAQTVKLMMIITHEGNVIGRTNTVDLVVNEPAEAPDPPLTPREQFDEVIAEQRAEIAEQAETISEQASQIEAKDGQISELNGQVTELEAENAEQAQTITRQNTTIDELNARRIPVYIEPQLVPKLITPSLSSQYEEPPEGKDGFSAITVNPITSDLIPNLEPQNVAKNKTVLGVTGTFDSFPENPVGGIYFYEPDENDNPTKCKIYKWRNTTWGDLLKGNSYVTVEDVTFVDTSITSISSSAFENCVGLKTVTFDNSVSTIGNQAFRGCLSLIDVTFGNNLTSIGVSAFAETELQTVVIPSGTIASKAFYQCYSLVRVECGDGVVSIGSQCFLYSPVNTLILAEGLKTIGDWAFGRVPLKTVNFPSTLTSVGGSTFASCTNLENVTLANGFNCNNLNLSASTLYSHDTILSWLNALADRTGETAYTLYIGSKNLNKLTAEQRAIATNKNWNLA